MNNDINPKDEKNRPENLSFNESEYREITIWRRKPMIIAGALLLGAFIILAVLAWLRSGDSQSGKPVPAPRSNGFDAPTDSAGQFASGQTLTLQPEQLRNAGIKIESVGEQLNSSESKSIATGTVQANAYKETPVISLVGGVVRKIDIQAGENISAGNTVAVIFSNEFAETQSKYVALLTERENARKNFERTEKLVQINQSGRSEFEQSEKQSKAAEAALEEMKKRFDRTTKLLKIGAASREELEQDTTKLRTAEAEAAEARSRFERSKELLKINPQSRTENEEAGNKLRSSEADLATMRQKLLLYGMSPDRIDSLRSPSQISSEIFVVAPVSGTITARSINQGETIEANKELARITNLSSMWVIAQVYEKDLARLRVGSGASISSEAFPERVFRGTVTYIDSKFDEKTRTAQIRIEVANPGNSLKVGMYVRVAFGALGDAERTVPEIFASAVQSINSQSIVFVPTSNPNVFELRPVRLGTESGGRYQVLEGLAVGDRVVTEGSFLLRAEWLKIQPR